MRIQTIAICIFIGISTHGVFLDKRRNLKRYDKDEVECDMKKKIVTAITIEEGPHVLYNHSCIDNLPESNSSYIELTKCIYGWMVDFFHVLEKHCNFKLIVYASKEDIAYGDVVKTMDGDYDLSGMFAEIEKFDMILGATLITEERAEKVNFIYPLVQTRMVIFIQNDLNHSKQWSMFFEVFTWEVWMLILAIAVLPAIMSALHDIFVLRENPLSFRTLARKFVASIALYFGGNFLERRNRVLILICHLSYGIVIWIYFRGSLTSKLTEQSYKYPFTSLEELSTTNYRLLTARNTTKVANHFMNAIENSPREKVWKNNMDNNSFIGLKKGAKKIFEESNTALYYYEMEGSYHLAMKDKYCDTLLPWKNDMKLLYSVAVNKNFSHFDSIDMISKRLKQAGMVQKFLFKHDIVPKSCEEEAHIEIGYEKVFPLFLLLIVAIIGSILYFIVIELRF